MHTWAVVLFQGLGGIGMSLLALEMLSQGLRLAGGETMRTVLSKWTNTPIRGLFFGFAATGILQSSTLITAIVVSLANAGIMPLYNAIWTIFGSNVGSTLTGWIISTVGLDMNLKAFALPFIGAGMFLKIMSKNQTPQAFGMALAGVGLFFVGIDFLKDAFGILTGEYHFDTIEQTGFISLLILIGIGLVTTVMLQSSMATMVIILTGASTGMLSLQAGAALVVGANIGTTSTAVFAAIGASPNAKRTSATHVIFNVVTAIIVVTFMPLILNGIQLAEHKLGLSGAAPLSLAIFHTLFSVIGVIVFWPFVPLLTRLLNKCFVIPIDNDSKTKFLDRASAEVPAIAIDTLAHELARLQRKTARHCLFLLNSEGRGSPKKQEALQELSSHISTFGEGISKENMDLHTAELLQAIFKINRHLNECLRVSAELPDFIKIRPTLERTPAALAAYDKFEKRLRDLLEKATKNQHFPIRARQTLRTDYRHAKHALLQQGLSKSLQHERLSAMLDTYSLTHRVGEQLIRANAHLATIYTPEGKTPANP